MNKLNGFLYGLLSSASFGLIPLFTIPVMRQGMQFESILLYRFAFATGTGTYLVTRRTIFPYQPPGYPFTHIVGISLSDVRRIPILGI